MDRKPVSLSEFNKNPFIEFEKWHSLAARSGKAESELNAMTLATASKDGIPSARTVLYKGIKDGGISFYTNYESAKAKTLDENPRAALVFYWPETYRQIRLEGKVKKMLRSDSEIYFNSRPRESQLGAWASNQSRPVDSFEILEEIFSELEKKYIGKDIPCPPYWGGYVLIPQNFEFWLGGTRRLHQRVKYGFHDDQWKVTLLSP